ncbi:hypothetical protein SNL152K_9087 [Streptomyces sp. NL15-2K]|nr:hypothetical protein SNL152K_9087 [Streptomyces sp. NL15-2K]
MPWEGPGPADGPGRPPGYFCASGVTAIWSTTGAYGERWPYWL